MEAFLFSTGVVALAEIGDKTQLLSFVLTAKFRKPLPIILGILVATLANHAAAGGLGAWIASLLSPMVLRLVVGLSFLAMTVWVLVPDRLDEEETSHRADAMLVDRYGRAIEYLRLSVTDRCDLRCAYCIPEGFKDFEEPAHWLTFTEVERLLGGVRP